MFEYGYKVVVLPRGELGQFFSFGGALKSPNYSMCSWANLVPFEWARNVMETRLKNLMPAATDRPSDPSKVYFNYILHSQIYFPITNHPHLFQAHTIQHHHHHTLNTHTFYQHSKLHPPCAPHNAHQIQFQFYLREVLAKSKSD